MNSRGKLPRRRFWYVCAFLTLLVLGLAATFQDSVHRAFVKEDSLTPADFPVYYVAGKMALAKLGQPLYYVPADRPWNWWYLPVDGSTPWTEVAHSIGFSGTFPFITPPFSAVMMAPFARLPWRAAYLAWQLVIAIFMAAAIYLTLRMAWAGEWVAAFCVFLAAALCFDPFRRNLMLGQIDAPILFLWAAGVYLLHRHQRMASALCMALGTVIKVAPAFAVPLLVIRRQWRWLAGYAVCAMGFTGLSVWRVGWQNHMIWLKKVYPALSCGIGVLDNRSLPGLIDLFSPGCLPAGFCPVPGGVCMFNKVAGLAVGLGFFYWCWRKSKDAQGLAHELTLLPLVFLLVSPWSEHHHYLLAILPLTYLWAKSREAGTHLEIAVLTLSTLIVGTVIPDYVATSIPWARSLWAVIDVGLWPAATLALIWIGMRMYDRPSLQEE